MLGSIIGDIVGSRFEHCNIKSKEFNFFHGSCQFTDDTVLTVATMGKYLLDKSFTDIYQEYFNRYPYAGYGGNFRKWGYSDKPTPYNSWGNGSAMRVAPIGWLFASLDETLTAAKRSAEVTHNHPDGILGAQAVAACIYLIRTGKSNDEIKNYVENILGYDLSFTLDDIRGNYTFDVSCKGSVPQAIVAYLEAESFEDTIRNAVSIGGDSDTIACIAGSIAEVKFGIEEIIIEEAMTYLDTNLIITVKEFYNKYIHTNL